MDIAEDEYAVNLYEGHLSQLISEMKSANQEAFSMELERNMVKKEKALKVIVHF
jgi:hypothetical protein